MADAPSSREMDTTMPSRPAREQSEGAIGDGKPSYETRMATAAGHYEHRRALGQVPGLSPVAAKTAVAEGAAPTSMTAGASGAGCATVPGSDGASRRAGDGAHSSHAPDEILDGWLGVVTRSTGTAGVCVALDALRAHIDSGSEVGRQL